jgi:hypothetical protein
MSDIFRDYSFGGWLKHYRCERGFTLRAMALKIKWDAGNYSRLENSRLNPPETLRRLRKITEPLKLKDVEEHMLSTAAFGFHFGQLKKKWENE